MRKLVYAINLTIDGCCDHTRMTPDEAMYGYHTRLLQEADVLLYGRKTYELMVPYWPDMAKNHSGDGEEENEYAAIFVAVDKMVVFSRTLESVEGRNTVIIRDNLRDEILALKQEEGKNILVGGVDLPSQLIALGLVDEYHFVIHPVLAGTGRRLLEATHLPEKLSLQLVSSKHFDSGCMALHYVR